MPSLHGCNARIACDAMCGGLARWLRVLGVDASYTPGIDDGALVEHALREQRVVVSSDGRLFDRRQFSTGELTGLRLPVGLALDGQVEFTIRRLALVAGVPRCAACNGRLRRVPRSEVADVVPARSLIWASEFRQCDDCGKVFWEGSHWRKIRYIRQRATRDPGRP